MREPRWVPRLVVETLHFDQLREHGGLAGLRDEGALEAALARPRQKWAYENEVDLPLLAAAYGFGLATVHAFVDGNKRAAFLTMAVFVGLNGYEIDASEPEVVTLMLGVADGKITEASLAAWLREHWVGYLG